MPRRRYSRGYARSRRRYKPGSALTGGTGDVNPQWMNLQTLTDALGSFTATTACKSVESIVPLQQQALMSSKGQKSMVMELLKVEFSKQAGTTGTGRVGITSKSLNSSTHTAAKPNELDINQPHVIASKDYDTGLDGVGRNIGSSSFYLREKLSVTLTDVRCVLWHCC